MREVINEAVSSLVSLRRKFEKKYGFNISSWNKQLFLIAIFLSIQNYVIQNEIRPEEVEEVLFSGFIIRNEEKRIIIDAYNAEEKKEELYGFFLKMLIVWESGVVQEDRKEQFAYTIFFFPFLAILEKVCSSKEEYESIYKKYMAQEMEKDWDGGKMKWTQISCEEEMREFWAEYSDYTEVIKQQNVIELLDKGYTVRSIELIEKNRPEESGGGENVRG